MLLLCARLCAAASLSAGEPPQSVLAPSGGRREREAVVVLDDDASSRVVYVDAFDNRTGRSFGEDDAFAESPYPDPAGEPYSCQLLPNGLMYRSYLAGPRESRFAGVWNHERDVGWVWDITLGGRVGIMRYGTTDPVRPEGWQIDIEGAALPRLDLEENRDMVSTDFRFGVPLTFRDGPIATKFGYYHLSSHLGDEYLEKHPEAERINYSRDVLILGLSYFPWDDVRLYGEVGWAFYTSGGAEPWEFQFGAEYSPMLPSCMSPYPLHAMPFAAINAHLHEEVNYSGDLTVQAGLQWRGAASGHLYRIGLEYFNGMSRQYQFHEDFEEQIGIGMWYDY
ncbi:MAG: DUF1207 domain-containing protein [Pirellulales bacterium]